MAAPKRHTQRLPGRNPCEFTAWHQEYEVGYFASKFGLSIPQVRELIAKHGNDRETLEREAKALGTQ
ncbi:hypothetical protein CK221_29370 [Mesorhizobium sp. WSM3868]|nr:hypothetical protein CK221_29370 [Mesorhizobium sp. WSM3868]